MVHFCKNNKFFDDLNSTKSYTFLVKIKTNCLQDSGRESSWDTFPKNQAKKWWGHQKRIKAILELYWAKRSNPPFKFVSPFLTFLPFWNFAHFSVKPFVYYNLWTSQKGYLIVFETYVTEQGKQGRKETIKINFLSVQV